MLKVRKETQIYVSLSPIDMRNYVELSIMWSVHSCIRILSYLDRNNSIKPRHNHST